VRRQHDAKLKEQATQRKAAALPEELLQHVSEQQESPATTERPDTEQRPKKKRKHNNHHKKKFAHVEVMTSSALDAPASSILSSKAATFQQRYLFGDRVARTSTPFSFSKQSAPFIFALDKP
jgi:sRNA-binding protein